jgi:hypothetical protein
MTWLDGYRMRLVLVGMVAAIVLGSGNARADFTFGEAIKLDEPLNSPFGDIFECISPDGLELYISSNREYPGSDNWEMYVSKRPTIDMEWGPLVNLGPTMNSWDEDLTLSMSPDGLELYLCSWIRPGGYGKGDMWVARRTNKNADWSVPVNLGPSINTSASEYGRISPDGLNLWVAVYGRSGGYGGWDFWTSSRETVSDAWPPLMNFGPPVNSSYHELAPTISSDGRVLFFCEYVYTGPYRQGGYGRADILVATRATSGDKWSTPVNVGPKINTSEHDVNPYISLDGATLYFTRTPTVNSGDIYQAPIIPIVDFTGDYIVDIEDLTILIEHWGQNEPAFDMGPTPLGDGVVDKADLEVLMSYWGQEVYDPHLLAHWMLDEIEGDVAYDSAAENDAIVIGDAVWLPESGQINGALQFDGIDDYIDTLFKLDPADGPFSVFAWVKGGTPGQVILSQEGGEDWLLTDTQGCLMTALQSNSGRIKSGPLISEMTITDGNWHRVGFVRDGSERILYVDDIEVVRDTVNTLDSASGNLYLGIGSNTEAGTFWSGLIDDVRIYDRVVTP